MLTLSRLSVYPVKSMRGTALSQSLVKPEGLIWDRHFMLTDKSGKFITARKYPEMVLFSPVTSSEGIYLQAPDNDTILARFADFQTDLQPTEVWGNPLYR